jgi:predicted transcriptional regulator
MAAKNPYIPESEIPRGLKAQVTRLAKLKARYETHLAEMAGEAAQIKRLEKSIGEKAAEREVSFVYRDLMVVYVSGGPSVSVDSAALREDAKENPDLEKYLLESERASYAYVRRA